MKQIKSGNSGYLLLECNRTTTVKNIATYNFEVHSGPTHISTEACLMVDSMVPCTGTDTSSMPTMAYMAPAGTAAMACRSRRPRRCRKGRSRGPRRCRKSRNTGPSRCGRGQEGVEGAVVDGQAGEEEVKKV